MEPYEKVVYVWNEPRPPVLVPERLHFHSIDEESFPILLQAVSQAMALSLDRHDLAEVARMGASEAARQFLAGADEAFGYELAWWQLGYDQAGDVVGFLLPVIYPGEQRNGLEEATIYYIGVTPNHRGKGYGIDLLYRATQTMQQVGVWRIYCDTDVKNTPMIKSFQQVGYEQQEADTAG